MERRAVARIIDANINRANEGLRVCEDIARFVLRDRRSTARFKSIRHRYNAAVNRMGAGRSALILARDSEADVGKATGRSERRRNGLAAVFCANIRRCEEAMRVLEELGKLDDGRSSSAFKRMRFELYALERTAVERFG